MTREIRTLDPATRDRIAAGEVVERPASAVKELVENALDADASRVEVAVEAGGTEGIRVVDDGVGMTREAVERAVEEHTTSKIRDIDDLEAGVGTLGFRGEALHAIAAVSRTTITTRPRPDDAAAGSIEPDEAAGTELVVAGGEVTSIGPAGRAPGTTVEVADLFYNVPARRKYLKQSSTEFAHVNSVVSRYALANPDVAVSLVHDGTETFATTGQGDLQAAVLSVYGREVARSMIPVGATAEGDGTVGDGANGDGEDGSTDSSTDGPLTSVSGLVSHPETNRAGREYLATYVNGRAVRSATLREAIVSAYGTQLAPDRYPFAVLFVCVDPGTVDVNVHPRKQEVRFADEAAVREQVREAVESALLREGLLRSGAPRGTSAAEQTEIAPDSGAGAGEGTIAGDAPVDAVAGRERASAASEQPTRDADTGGRSTRDGSEQVVTDADTGEQPTPDVGEQRATGADHAPTGTEPPESASDRPSAPTDRSSPIRHGPNAQARLGDAEPTEQFDSLPAMRILGQFADTYVVAETADGLILVDQHAADERINYEHLRESFAGETTTQSLAEPVTVELTAREAALFAERADALADLGFHADRVDERSLEVTAVPGLLADAGGPSLVRDVLSSFVEGDPAADEMVQSAADELLADLACYPSITGNTSLTEGSIRSLLDALDDCENPWACPHGRPVVVELSMADLEARFERDYPGHGGRRDA